MAEGFKPTKAIKQSPSDERDDRTSTVELTSTLLENGSDKHRPYGTSFSNSKQSSLYYGLKNTATILSSTINVCNTVMGAGLLGLPSAIENTGYILGILLFVIFSGVAMFTMHLQMCVAATMKHKVTYKAMCDVITIRKLKNIVDVIVDITIGLAMWGTCVAYFVIIGDAMDLAMEQFLDGINVNDNVYQVLISKYFWMIIYGITLITPLTLLKKYDNLKYTSVISLIIFVLLMITIIIYWLFPELNDHETPVNTKPVPETSIGWLNFFKSAPVFIFAYECHTNLNPMKNELYNPTIPRLNRVIIYTIGFCSIIYLLIGYAGYLTFGDMTDSNILNNYPQNNVIGVLRVGLSFSITFSYPICMYPAREAFSTLIFKKHISKLNDVQYYILTLILIITSFIVAIIADDLEIVLGLVGSFGGCMIVFILPGLFYILTPNMELKTQKYYLIKKKISKILVIIGIILIPFGIVMQFIDVENS